MGGGDLNMKKHFHPLTMQNLERVWKAEQKAKEEAEKLEQLQRELEEERRRELLQQHAVEQGIIKKKNQKLDWMYAGPQVNHEEYLLGRKIDKNVEILKENENDQAETAGANFVPEIADPVKDMAAKIKEDPLFLIRKKEEESKKELVQNPIKLRKLKEMLNMSVKDKLKKNKKSKKSKHRKEKKQRKRKHDSDTESDEGSEEDMKAIRKRERSLVAEQNGYGKDRGRRNQDNESGDKRRRDRTYSASSDDGRKRGSVRRKDDGKSRAMSREGDSWREDRNGHMRWEGKKMNDKRRESKNERERSEGNRDRRYEKELSKRDEKSTDKVKKEQSRKVDREMRHKNGGREKIQIKREASSEDETDSSDYERKRSRKNSTNKKYDSDGERIPGSARKIGRSYGLIQHKATDERGSKHEKTQHAGREDTRHYENGIKRSRKDGRKPRHDSSSDSSQERQRSSKNTKSRAKEDYTHKERSRNGRDVHRRNGPPSSGPTSRMISSNVSRKLTQEELEKKRQEMMDNAKWRDDQRGKNIQKYKMEEESEEKEEKRRAVSPDSKAKFIHDLQVKSYSSSHTASVEDRIKRNIYTKQRTRDALSKKFTEK